MISFPNKKYSIIYADPPWNYKDKACAGKRGAGFKYKTMSIKDIQELPVQNISGDNCMLFIWVTFPLLQEGMDTIKLWGFKYKTIGFNWIKLNKKARTRFWGMGNWTRSNSELCLLGIKGKPKRISASVHSIVISHKEEHSKKPNLVRDRIIKLCGDITRIELFAREKIQGWDCWGDEV